MREILFRAKPKDWQTNPKHNKWVEGFYCNKQETTYCFTSDYEKFPVETQHYIIQERMVDWGLPNEFRLIEIDPETVCQYTGITDKNGVKIFEKDILDTFDRLVEVTWLSGNAQFDCRFIRYAHDREIINFKGIYPRDFDRLEVIGNIFDNPELIKT